MDREATRACFIFHSARCALLKIFFRGRRQWPQGSRIRRPQVRRVGVLEKRGSKRAAYSKNSLLKSSRGRGAGEPKGSTWSPRGSPGPLLPRRREAENGSGDAAGRLRCSGRDPRVSRGATGSRFGGSRGALGRPPGSFWGGFGVVFELILEPKICNLGSEAKHMRRYVNDFKKRKKAVVDTVKNRQGCAAV